MDGGPGLGRGVFARARLEAAIRPLLTLALLLALATSTGAATTRCTTYEEKTLKIQVYEDIKIREWVRVRSKEQGIRGYACETISGDELSRSDQMWVSKIRVIHKIRDWYEERVIDPETDAILHDCTEPSSPHQGHGSAKKHPPRH